MNDNELGKAILDADKQMKELLRNGDIGRTLREINDFNKLAEPNEVQKALADINKTMASSHGISSYEENFARVKNLLFKHLDEMRSNLGYDVSAGSNKKNLAELEAENSTLKAVIENQKSEIDSLKKSLCLLELNLVHSSEIGPVLQRVHEQTHEKLLSKTAIQIAELIYPSSCTAFLVSIDIRRSTDLMLNAKDAKQFATFSNELSVGLANIVKEHFGVFDKFTGDGILAFFPSDFSGDGAATNILLAARKAHLLFAEHYKNSRSVFNLVLNNTGLGIGIDYGDVNIVRLSDGLTAIGRPVVFACRFSSADAGVTAVNQAAYEIMKTSDSLLSFEEIEVDVKNLGKHLAYRPKNSPRSELIKEPEWFSASPTSAE